MTSVYEYCRLITYSVGLQEVMKQGKLKDDTMFFAGCLHAASAVVNCVVERILPTGFIRFSPEQVFALSAYGAAMLTKCLRPEFSCKLDQRQETRVVELIKRLAQAMDATDVGADDSTPRRRFSRFLQQLVASRIWERRHAGSDACGQPQAEAGAGPGPSQYVPALAPSVGPQGPMGPAQAQLRPPHLELPDHNMHLPPNWDAQTVHPDQMQSLFTFSEQDIIPNFMTFPDQTSTWFM